MGEIATRQILVVINKVDLLPVELRPKLIAKARKRLAQTFAATTFAGCPMVAVSAKPGEHFCTSLTTPTAQASLVMSPRSVGVVVNLQDWLSLYRDINMQSLKQKIAGPAMSHVQTLSAVLGTPAQIPRIAEAGLKTAKCKVHREVP